MVSKKNGLASILCIIRIIKPKCLCQFETAVRNPTLSLGLFNHCAKGLFVSMDRVDLLEIKGFRSVSLDRVKRAENQAFHLQLVYVVQLLFNSYREQRRSAGREREMSCQCNFSQMGRDKRAFACECEEGQEVRERGQKAGETL